MKTFSQVNHKNSQRPLLPDKPPTVSLKTQNGNKMYRFYRTENTIVCTLKKKKFKKCWIIKNYFLYIYNILITFRYFLLLTTKLFWNLVGRGKKSRTFVCKYRTISEHVRDGHNGLFVQWNGIRDNNNVLMSVLSGSFCSMKKTL